MKEYWWNYALAKSRMTGLTTEQRPHRYLLDTGGGTPAPSGSHPPTRGQGRGGNQAWSRLNAATAQSRGQFRLGGALTGMFSNKETANQWFNEIISQLMSDVIPAQIAGGSLQAMGVMPDPIQELLMTFLERSGTVGAALGGYIGYGIQGLEGLAAGPFRATVRRRSSSGAFGRREGIAMRSVATPTCLAWRTYRGYCRLWDWGSSDHRSRAISTSTSLAVTSETLGPPGGLPRRAGLHPTMKRRHRSDDEGQPEDPGHLRAA